MKDSVITALGISEALEEYHIDQQITKRSFYNLFVLI